MNSIRSRLLGRHTVLFVTFESTWRDAVRDSLENGCEGN